MNLLKATSQTNCLFLLTSKILPFRCILGCCLTLAKFEALVLLSHLAVITNALGRWLINHHELMNSLVTRLLIKSMNSFDDVLLEKSSVEAALLHKSSLHVQTVAWPSSMHFSAPCIQQARNKTTPSTTCLMQPLLLIKSLHSSHCLLPSEVKTGRGRT